MFPCHKMDTAMRIPEKTVIMDLYSVALMMLKHIFIPGYYWKIFLEIFLWEL
jgi:hypothetical protein